MLKKVDLKNRISELDLLKGIAVIIMLFNHIFYDVGIAFGNSFLGTALENACILCENIHRSQLSRIITFIFCSSIFISVSGVCSTFAKHTFKEGILLSVIAFTITFISAIISKIMDTRMEIWFGIIHLLAVCMILSPLLNKIPTIVLPFLSIICCVLGIIFKNYTVQADILALLNFKVIGFASADYYPILPHISFYIAGIFIGKTLYKDKKTILTFSDKKTFIPLRFLGAYSFEIYILHQPLVYLIVWLITLVV